MTFAKAVSADVGTGDVIQYDVDNDSDIDSNDAVPIVRDYITEAQRTYTKLETENPVPRTAPTPPPR